jgi:putative ABC transport system permease protein
MLPAHAPDISYALRRLRRAPSASALAVVVAALGIGSSTAAFSVLEAVILRPLPYPDSDRLVQISEMDPEQAGVSSRGFADARVNPQNYLDYARASSFSAIAWASPYVSLGVGSIGRGEGSPETVEVMSVAPTFFDVLGVMPALGRPFGEEEARTPFQWNASGAGVVILSHELWASRFGSDPSIVGASVTFEGGPAEVVGVMPAGFAFPPLSERGEVRERDVAVYIPPDVRWFTFRRESGGHLPVIARLAPGVGLEQARSELSRITASLVEAYPELPRGLTTVVAPLRDHLVRDYGRPLSTLAALVALVLLVASTNLAGLMLARGATRRGELGVRNALGASRLQLMRLVLVESVLLAGFGGALGVVLARWGTRALIALAPVDIARASTAELNSWVLAFAVSVSLAVGICAGLAPALRGSGIDLAGALRRDATRVTRGTGRISGALVTAQVALTLVTLAAAAVLGTSYLRLRDVDLGFDPANVLRVAIDRGEVDGGREIGWFDPGNRRARWSTSGEIMARLRELPGVISVAAGDVNIDRVNTYTVRIGEGVDARPLRAYAEWVSPEYFATLGIPIVRGRGMAPWNRADDADRYWWSTDAPDCRVGAKLDPRLIGEALASTERCDGPAVVVSETFAAMAWPGRDPIGEALGIQGCCWTVAGVARDVNARGIDAATVGGPIDETPALTLYVPYTDIGPFLVKVEGDPLSLVPAIREVVAGVGPSWPVTFTTLEERVAESLSRPRFYSLVTLIAALCALLLALAGLYAVVAQDVVRRVHEIGVRTALGASPGSILALIVRDGLEPVLWGLGFGLASTILVAQYLERLLYGMAPLDVQAIGGVALVMLIVAAAACCVPAMRALRVDPARALSDA